MTEKEKNEKYNELGIHMKKITENCTPDAPNTHHVTREAESVTPSTEKAIEAYLREQVERRDGECIKLTSQFQRGLPDRLILTSDGRHCFVELKGPEGRLSPLQVWTIARLRRNGHPVFVIRKREQVNVLMDLIDMKVKFTNDIEL